MDERIKRRLHILEALRVFCADAVIVSDLGSSNDIHYFEGMRDGLKVALSLFDDLCRYDDEELTTDERP